MAYNIKINSNYLLITNTETQTFTDRPAKDIVICKGFTSDINYTVYYNGKEIDGLVDIPFTDFQQDGVPFTDEIDFENFICENTGGGGGASSGGATFPSTMNVNATGINGTPYNTSSGFIDNGTQRVIQAYRVEAVIGGFGTTEILTLNGSRIKALLVTNNTNNVMYVQIHSKLTALVTGDVPLFGLTIRLPANSTLDKNAGDYGESGILYGSNIRMALSSTFGTFTPISPANTSMSILITN